MTARKFLLFSLVLLISLGADAQNADEALEEKRERELKLIDQIKTDAQNLRLPENRAIVSARLGSALWRTDEKQARKLFDNALAEVVAAQTEALNERAGRQFFQNLIFGQSPRLEVVNLVAGCDAELALDFLAQSRPAAIAAAMFRPGDETSLVQQYARNEIAAEQRLLGLAAEQNPERAIKRVRESLKKGVSYETLNLLLKIYSKDPAAAEKLAVELAESFLTYDYSKYSQSAELVGNFVAEMGRQRAPEEKSLKIPDELLRRLAAKMTDDWRKNKNGQMGGFNSSKPVVEKYFPERAAQIQKQIERYNEQYQNAEALQYTKLVSSSETTPEELVAQAENFQSGYRNEIYRAAAAKSASAGKIAEAEKILRDGISDEMTPHYLSQMYINLSYQLIAQNKLDEAIFYINRIEDENQRVFALINLANTVYGQNPKENDKRAKEILGQARALVPDVPETQHDFNTATQLAAAFAPLDTDESFRLVESMIAPYNELIQAHFVMMKFRSYGGVRQGEMQMTGGNNLGVFNLEGTFRALKEKDFERALRLTNGFQRIESRLWLQLHLLDENSATNGVNLPLKPRFVKRSFS